MQIKKSVSKFLTAHKDDSDKIEKFSDFLNNFFEHMDEEYADVKDAFKEELDDVVSEITIEMIDAILYNLKTKEGAKIGPKWTMAETDNVAKQYDTANKIANLGKEYDSCLFYFAMNYVYIVHNNPNRTLNGYIDLAIDEYTNKNVCLKDIIKKLFRKI